MIGVKRSIAIGYQLLDRLVEQFRSRITKQSFRLAVDQSDSPLFIDHYYRAGSSFNHEARSIVSATSHNFRGIKHAGRPSDYRYQKNDQRSGDNRYPECRLIKSSTLAH